MKRIAVIGNYLPRQCGIATFTADLCEAIASASPELSVFAIPINDREGGYDYPARVRFEISENDLNSYRQAADFLNINKVDAVCIQHEFGIYGGPEGSHVLSLVRDLRPPLVTTLHTIPRYPNPVQRHILEEVAEFSDRVVVMSEKGASFLKEIYKVPAAKIDQIPHGIHDVPFVDPHFYKDNFGVEGKFVLLTFGLLLQNKGIEYVIRALPTILETHPEVVLVVVGATHPCVLRVEGETYRLSLQRLARQLGVENHVIFHNRFVTLEELMQFIGAADVYITPYRNQDQITSGTLAYALGAGKAVVATPYWYAEELLGDGAGVLVPFCDASGIAQGVLGLLDDDVQRHAMRKRGYLRGREMIWPEVGRKYICSLQRAAEERCVQPRARFTPKTVAQDESELPAFKMDHLTRLTDDVGLLQYAVGSVPDYAEGYTTDDNARALVLGVLLEELGPEWLAPAAMLPNRSMAFLWYAFDRPLGRVRRSMRYDRTWKDDGMSMEAHGRALWALGAVLGRSRQEGLRRAAGKMFEAALPAALQSVALRPAAYTLVGLHDYLQRYPGDRVVQQARQALAETLLDAYQQNGTEDWPWFEAQLSYGNATLPHGLLLAGHAMGRSEMVDAALTSLTWLATLQTADDGHFAPLGNEGVYARGEQRARFDQLPVESHAMLSACLAALRISADRRWKHEAHRAFEWFLGWNDTGIALYDPASGGCYDGLKREGVNTNQGAESTLAFLMSLAELRLHQQIIPPATGILGLDHETEPAKRVALPKHLTEAV